MLAAGVLLMVVLTVSGQVEHGGRPEVSPLPVPRTADLSRVRVPDVARLLAEDRNATKEAPFRIADVIDVRIPLQRWAVAEQGGRKIYRVTVQSPGAHALGLNFARFRLPEGGRLFVFSKATTRGAFTPENHKSYGGFAVLPVKGDSATVEVSVPAESKGVDVEIESVAHHYKNTWFAPQDLEGCYGCSGSCNINMACPLGHGWSSQGQGVAAILTSRGSALCSGSMINNVEENGKQYFLSANHCGCSNAHTWILVFNYQTATCTNPASPPSDRDSVQGSIVLASAGVEDFCLIDVQESIPPQYNVFLNGFDARPDSSFAKPYSISHPSGDVKKAAFFGGLAVPSGYFTEGKSHWFIAEWDQGVTEGGSSGSPIFDDQKRIRGQLHGGYASCSYLYVDYYGRLSESWTSGTASNQRLDVHLDPRSTGVLVVDGMYLNTLRARNTTAKH